jgi:hypothetical protein
MRPRTEIPATEGGAIRRAMLAAPNASAFQRLQCLRLPARQHLSTETIAQTVGLILRDVRRVWSDYLQGGLVAAQGWPKGGRRHQNLTVKAEENTLAPLHQQAKTGRLITAGSIKTRYEARVGRAVSDSTVYRLLARHQWQQVTPRPKHPKDNPAARAAFKKLQAKVNAVAAGPPQQSLRLLFEDEARFGRMSNPVRCQVPAGWLVLPHADTDAMCCIWRKSPSGIPTSTF